MAYPLTALGNVQLARGRSVAALASLERALAIRESAGIGGIYLAETQFALARALWAANRDRKRAISPVRKARDVYASLGEGRKKELAEVERWLAARSLTR